MYYVDIHSNIYIIHNNTVHIQWYNNGTFVKQIIDISFEVEPKYMCCSKQYIIIADNININIYNISTQKLIKESLEFQIKQIHIVGSELYITTQNKLIKYNIPSLFNGKNIISIIDFPEDYIYAQYGRYYNYIECGKTAYIYGTNYFKHFGGLQELHYPSWTPIQPSMMFSDKTSVEVCNNSIKIYGTVPHIIELVRPPIKNHISLIDNSIAFIIPSETEANYELYIYKMEKSTWNFNLYPLDVEIFFQGIDWIRLNTCGVLIKLLNNTVLFYCHSQQTCVPVLQLPASCHAVQLPACLSASNHSAYHTVWFNLHIYSIGRNCHNIIQNYHEITNIQMNNYYTLYLFRNNTCISITNTGELDIELFPSNIISIACGNEHYIALCPNGTVWIRGDNSYGQLGINRYSPFEDWVQLTDREFIDNAQDILAAISLNKNAVKLSSDSRYIIKISTGIDTSFFIAKDYSIYACGCNTAGQLGIGTQFNRKQPTRLNRFAGILTASQDRIDSIAGGKDFTVFLTQAGDVYLAGFSQHLFPHKIATNIIQIAVGLEHYILLDKTGTATTNTGATINNCIQIITGAHHSIFITVNGILAAGQNSYKQCGNFQHISPYPSINALKN